MIEFTVGIVAGVYLAKKVAWFKNLEIQEFWKPTYNIIKIGDKYTLSCKWFGFTRLKDLTNQTMWWKKGSAFYYDCIGDYKKVEKFYNGYVYESEVVK